MPPLTITTAKGVNSLQKALQRIGHPVDETEVKTGKVGTSTSQALADFQRANNLPADGKPTADTLTKLTDVTHSRWVMDSKTRTATVQELLTALKLPVDAAEVKARTVGDTTKAAVLAFQRANGLPTDGLLSEALLAKLREKVVEGKFTSITQVTKLHKSLGRIKNLSKLEVNIDPAEIKARQIGSTTTAFIKAFQEKYRLPITGKIDPTTLDRIESVLASRPDAPKLLKIQSGQQLERTVTFPLRINMVRSEVKHLQQALAFADGGAYAIDEKEFNTSTFGKSTRTAVLAFQKAQRLPVTGELDKATANRLNQLLVHAKPSLKVPEKYRVRGSVRDELWQGKGAIRVQVLEKLLRGENPKVLGEQRTFENGFFDITYSPPINPITGQIKDIFHLSVKMLAADGSLVGNPLVLMNAAKVSWANFTEGNTPYQGASEFEVLMKKLDAALSPRNAAGQPVPVLAPEAIEETTENNDVTHLMVETGLTANDIMRLSLAHRLAAIARSEGAFDQLTPPVFYSFIRQNLPPNLPGDLLHPEDSDTDGRISKAEWDAFIEQTKTDTLNGLVFLDDDILTIALDTALSSNWVPPGIGVRKDTVLAQLHALRLQRTLNQPILLGNGTLNALLNTAQTPAAGRTQIADLLVKNQGTTSQFWQGVTTIVGAGPADALQKTVTLGTITLNQPQTLQAVQANLTAAGKPVHEVAKFSQADWRSLIKAGDPLATQPDELAVAMRQQAEQEFPAIAFVATTKQKAVAELSHIDAIETILDAHPQFNFRTQPVDTFIRDNSLTVAPAVQTEMNMLGRVHKLAPDADAGAALLQKKYYSAGQIYAKGRESFVADMSTLLGQEKASQVFDASATQYASVLKLLSTFRLDLNRGTPAALFPWGKLTATEKTQLETLIPDLETLFGPTDFCDITHSQSVLGPAAYLTDILRFLSQKPARTAGQTVLDVLTARRPDLVNIKLSSENTDTALPYIDLVCEILENAIEPPQPDFSFQSTLTSAELRATPEYIRQAAYDTLRSADFPIQPTFDYGVEATRLYLNHLGTPRHELMETFRNELTATPSLADIAAEYFGVAPHEQAIITTALTNPANATEKAKLADYWGFDPTQPTVTVDLFKQHSGLDYGQLLDLLTNVRFFNNDPNPANRIVIGRDVHCNTQTQEIENVGFAQLDQIHRFLRLWRHTSWTFAELDELLTATGSAIDETVLVKLWQLARLQTLLDLSASTLSSFYVNISRESRYQFNDDRVGKSDYDKLFQSLSLTNPLDPAFANPDGSETLTAHRSTLLATLGLTTAELDELLTQLPDDQLTLANLSALYRHVQLSQALRLNVVDYSKLLDVTAENPFASPEKTLRWVRVYHQYIKKSGFSALELSYVLLPDPDSPLGLRDEVLQQQANTLVSSLQSQPDDTARTEAAIESLASMYDLTISQTAFLVNALMLNDQPIRQALLGTVADDQKAVFILLHKVALLVKKWRLNSDDLAWFVSQPSVSNTLDFSALPVQNPLPNSLFPAWLNLQKLLLFRQKFPEPEGAALRNILAKAASGDRDSTLTLLTQLTQYNKFDALASALNWADAADFTKADTYERLLDALEQLRKTGVDPDTLVGWLDRTNQDVARQTQQAAKAKYDPVQWLTVVQPLHDALREKKRDALVAYLIEQAQRQFPDPQDARHWKNTNALFNYFLIDVEMGAIQLTSRVKQAISSVQLFVQRCFMNLEPDVAVPQQDSDQSNNWAQWKWMKNYRLWEANRQVFLYPENWIEPELRDDKSPFYEELENELMQNDITHENVEKAFANYLEKVDEVARLDVAAVYHEIDTQKGVDTLHVVGRTKSIPHQYYYRTYVTAYGTWTAWEKIDLDINSDQVTLAVYNRKLHLFWLTINRKPQKMKRLPGAAATNATISTPEPPEQLELQLTWSVRRTEGWTPKKVGRQKLIHPWPRPTFSYNLRPRYKNTHQENLLWLDVYLSVSREFNEGRFFDVYKYEAMNDGKAQVRLTNVGYQEDIRPWHSSSFVFDGELTQVKMKGLAGFFYVNGKLTPSDSFTYLTQNFGDDARAIERLEGRYETASRLTLPARMRFHNTSLINQTNSRSVNVLEGDKTVTLFSGGSPEFRIIYPQQNLHENPEDRLLQFDTLLEHPFFYQDSVRSFLIKPEWQMYFNWTKGFYGVRFWADRFVKMRPRVVVEKRANYQLSPFYHPYTKLFLREFSRLGVDGLLKRNLQTQPQTFQPTNNYNFTTAYPAKLLRLTVAETAQTDRLDFSRGGAYAQYNWEIFFHAPFQIACKLSQNQRFEDAMRWFHYIFDPTNADNVAAPQRYWITKPFYDQNAADYRQQRIEAILNQIGDHTQELAEWKNKPFQPHVIARYRPVAYQRTVVAKYLDNLIAWGDQLFRRDTIESINEASLLYILASEILGERPEKIPPVKRADKTFTELTQTGVDDFGNSQIDVLLEGVVPLPTSVVPTAELTESLPHLNLLPVTGDDGTKMLYFGIPTNDKLLAYWDLIADRLFKIRHSLNIEGVFRQLPLFEPPIDPALLVKAAAAGIDISSLLLTFDPQLCPYRYRVLVQMALEFTNDVKSFGERLLSTLEKKDAESLALLRSEHEIALLQATRDVRVQQVKEAEEQVKALEASRNMAIERKTYYEGLAFINTQEGQAIDLSKNSITLTNIVSLGYVSAGMFSIIPDFILGAAGFGGSPTATAETGGDKLGKVASFAAQALLQTSSSLDKMAALSSTLGAYQRRKDEWGLQARLATIEITQLDHQLEAAQIRLAIAQKELNNHDLQREQSQLVDDFMRSKYTNRQLYDWMLTQLSTVYFQSYQLAYDMAKRAEKAMAYELGLAGSSIIQPAYWDSLKKGLLAGDKLGLDLRRLEVAYLDQNTRRYELAKHISLANFFPRQLLQIKENADGKAQITLPEWLFDMDYPGHYQRRIKSVSISIPCVTGPYTSVNCTLSLTGSRIRLTNTPTDDELNFDSRPALVKSIATSHAQRDSGLFELNFSDDRFLPFEGAGVIDSQWTISLPHKTNFFDFASIADIILHINYSALDGGDALRQVAEARLDAALPISGVRLFSLREEFPDAWYRFLNPTAGADQEAILAVKADHFPFFTRGKAVKVNHLLVVADSKSDAPYTAQIQIANGTPLDLTLTRNSADFKDVQIGETALNPVADGLGTWTIKLKRETDTGFRSLPDGEVSNVWIVAGFGI
jgi:peptidoglycan hydrolase-like protein with peptidoglycan-binding domain